METLVFALDEAAASTSANSAASSAFSPKAVSASVTMSETVPSSSPDAAARFMTGAIPASICSVFHPAIAMYEKASADSVAEYFVFAPISLAFSVRATRSSPVAPEMAATLLIPCSKSMKVFADAVSPAAAAADMGAIACPKLVILSPAFFMDPPTDSIFWPIRSRLDGSSLSFVSRLFNSVSALFSCSCHLSVAVSAFSYSAVSFATSSEFSP